MSDVRRDRSIQPRWRLVLALFGVGVMSTACASYVAAPLRLEAYPARRAAAILPPSLDGRAWTAAELLAEAARRDPALAEAKAKYVTARAAARASRAGPPLGLTLTAEYAMAEPRPWLYGLGVDIPLDRGARRSERLTAADLGPLRARFDYADALWKTRMALTRALIERRFAEQFSVEAGAAEAVRRDRAERFERRVAAGEDERAQALAARTDLDVAQRRMEEALGRRVAADAALAAALGAPTSAVRTLALAPPTSTTESDVASAGRAAALARPEILRAAADYDLAESGLRLEIARQYPDVHLGPGFVYDHGVAKWPLNLALTLPPRDLNRASIAEAQARRQEAARAVESAQASVLSAVDAAEAALKTARAATRAIETRTLPTAEAQAASAARAVAAGAADRVDELAARVQVLEARLTLLDALKAEALARLDLEDALHTPFDPAEVAALETLSRALGDDDYARR